MPDTPALDLTVIPSFGSGLGFEWRVHGGVVDSLPWRFFVDRSQGGEEGPWAQIGGPIETAYVWHDPTRVIVSRDAPQFFRVRLTTLSRTYTSAPVSAYGKLDRRKFALAREIMRREMLYARKNCNGTDGSAFTKNVAGAPCPVCLDPITGGAVYGSDCPTCGGTKFNPPYLGPYPIFATFTTDSRHTVNAPDGIGKITASTYTARVAGAVWLRSGDLIKSGGQIFQVERVTINAEVGQLPVVQTADVCMIPLGDPLYILEMLQ